MLTTSPEIAELAAALAAAQGAITGAKKDSTVTIPGQTMRRYADLDAVLTACRDPLSKNGLSVIQGPGEIEGGQLRLTTLLLHKSGQWVRNEYAMPCQQVTPQGAGSAITYARRYSLMALIGIAPEDDDGQAAEAAAKSAPKPQQAPPLPNAFEEKARFLNRLREKFAYFELSRKEEGEIALALLRDVPEKWTGEVWAKCADAPDSDLVEAVNRTLMARETPEEDAD
jgi:hypothetical protein